MADGSPIAGNWAYQSYLNTAEQPIFGAGVFAFAAPSGASVRGTLDMGGGLVLDLEGTIRSPARDHPLTVSFVGTGRAGTATDGWEYDYHAFLAHHWPKGVAQVPALVGSVIRAKPHNGGAAGVTASFIAVKQP